MVKIDKKTLEDLEFPQVLAQVGEFCITAPGHTRMLETTPFALQEQVVPELNRVKEFTASFGSDSPIPNHSFEPIFKELRLFEIENSTLEAFSFRKILTLSEVTHALLKFFKKFEEFYVALQSFASEVEFTPILSEEIRKIFDKYGEVKDDASENLGTIRRRLHVVKAQINTSFSKALTRYASADYLDEIRETVVDNRRVLAVKAMHRRKIKGAVLGQSKTGSIVYIEPQETLEYANELSTLVYEESEEIKRILKQLTEFIRPYAGLLASFQEFLITIDCIYAKAKYAIEINGQNPIYFDGVF